MLRNGNIFKTNLTEVRLLTTEHEKIFLSTASKNYPSKRKLALKKKRELFLSYYFRVLKKNVN